MIRRSALSGLLPVAAFGVCSISVLGEGQEADRLDHLVRLAAGELYVTPISGNLPVDQRISDDQLRSDTFVNPHIVLGQEDTLVFLEQTATDGPTRSKSSPPRPGFRVVEVQFQDGSAPVRRELFKATFSSVTVATVDRNAPAGILKWEYRPPEAPTRPVSRSFGYGIAEKRFIERPNGTLDPLAHSGWTVRRAGDSTLVWEASPRTESSADQGQTNLTRRYTLLATAANPNRYEITADLSISFATWSRSIAIRNIPFPTDAAFSSKLRETLSRLPAPAGSGHAANSIRSSDSLLLVPFGSPAAPNLPAEPRDAGLVIDLKRLEKRVLAGLIEDLKGRIRLLEQIPVRDSNGDERFRQFVALDADLLIAEAFLAARFDALESAAMKEGIDRTQAKLSSLVFQFPFESDGRPQTIVYTPGRNQLLVVPENRKWIPKDADPLQFASPNGKQRLALRLVEEAPVRISQEETAPLKEAIAKAFGFPGIRQSTLLTRLPAGKALLRIGKDGSGADEMRTAEVMDSAISSDGSLSLSLSVSDAESAKLISLYLGRTGLPIDFDLTPLLRLRAGAPNGMSQTDPSSVIRARVLTPNGFETFSETKKTIKVTVMVDEANFTKLGAEEITVLLCYASDRERQHPWSVPVPRSTREATKEIPIKIVGGRLEPGMHFSLDGEDWILCETALYGLVFVGEN